MREMVYPESKNEEAEISGQKEESRRRMQKRRAHRIKEIAHEHNGSGGASLC
jgi:hypothetical protein